MTQAEFIASVEAKPNFIKWAKVPTLFETEGPIQKWNGVAYITTNEGYRNTFNVWFMVDTETGEATWQNIDTMEPVKNASNTALDNISKYLKANFEHYFYVPNHIDVFNKWAEAEVFTTLDGKLIRSNVIVYKPAGTAMTHKVIA